VRKNVAGQKWRVFAFNRLTSMPVIGDSAQITAKISIDYGTRNPSADTNPTEAEDGYYYFDLSQAETNGGIVEIFPESVTANVQVIGVPGRELPASAVPLTGGSSDPNNLFIYEAGQTDLYAFPASDDYPFSGWNTHRVLCTELIPGLYRAMIDPDKSTLWSVFDGAAAPSTHDAAIATLSYGLAAGIEEGWTESVDAQLAAIAAKTNLLGTGAVSVVAMVTPTGEIASPIIIGDDYLEANSRAFEWTVPAVPGVVVGTAQFHFGGKPVTGGPGWLVLGEVSNAGGGNWRVSSELPRAATQNLLEGLYRWSGEIRDASGNEITRIRSDGNRHVQLVQKQT
jgi:hypothetical protein